MLQRYVSGVSWSIPLVGLALILCAAPKAEAKDDPSVDKKVVHLQICLYELREAKEDVRDVKGLPDGEKKEILGGIDAGIDLLKKTIEGAGGKVAYIKPEPRPEYPDFKHLRHAVTALKTAKEQLKVQEGVPDDVREAGLKEIDKMMRHLDKAIDHIK